MGILKLAAGVAVGYVLGSRAGREQYENIAATARKVGAHPRVVDAQDKAKSLLGTGTDKVNAKLHAAAVSADPKSADSKSTDSKSTDNPSTGTGYSGSSTSSVVTEPITPATTTITEPITTPATTASKSRSARTTANRPAEFGVATEPTL